MKHQKSYPYRCELCHYFDGKRWENDDRTKQAGLCNKHFEMTFRTDTCKQFFSVDNLPAEEIFKPQDEQLKIDL